MNAGAKVRLALSCLVALTLASTLAGRAAADVYIGVGAALAITDVETNCPSCSQYDVHKASIKPTGYFGYRISNTAIEAGLGYSAYRGHAVMPDRPADIRQDIDSRYAYLAAIQFIPVPIGEFFGGIGLAHVWARNHEHGLNRDTSTTVPAHHMENITWTSESALFLQAGWQSDHVRLSASIIPDVVRSPWTGRQNIGQFSATYYWSYP